jgi:hypothetical protein
LDSLHQHFLSRFSKLLHLLQELDPIGAVDRRDNKEFEKRNGVGQGGGLGNRLEVRATARKRKPLAAFLDQKDGESIVDMLEVRPLGYPLISIGIFWKSPGEAESIDLF